MRNRDEDAVIKKPKRMDTRLRPAAASDIPDLARLLMMATHGLTEALYHDLVPGLATSKIVERRFHRAGTIASYANCWVAAHRHSVIGQVHAFPFGDAAKDPPDDLIPEKRRFLIEPLVDFDEAGQDSYYVNALAVYPEYRGNGVGTKLLRLARAHAVTRGFTRLSLITFEEDLRLVAYYRSLGFSIVGHAPIRPDERIRHSGSYILMISSL